MATDTSPTPERPASKAVPANRARVLELRRIKYTIDPDELERAANAADSREPSGSSTSRPRPKQ